MTRIRQIHVGTNGRQLSFMETGADTVLTVDPESYDIVAFNPTTRTGWKLEKVAKKGWTFTTNKREPVTPYTDTPEQQVMECMKRWPQTLSYLLIEPE